jgi:hypothetical protein
MPHYIACSRCTPDSELQGHAEKLNYVGLDRTPALHILAAYSFQLICVPYLIREFVSDCDTVLDIKFIMVTTYLSSQI